MYDKQLQNNPSFHSASGRHWALRIAALVFTAFVLAGLVLPLSQLSSVYANQSYLGTIRHLAPATYNGSEASVRAVTARQSTALSLAAEDFDVDGVTDLAVGLSAPRGGLIAIHRGDVSAFIPQDQATVDAIARGEYPSPYLPGAQLIDIPEQPDFLAAGDVAGIAGPGVVAARRNGSTLYVITRGPQGLMDVEQTVAVPGAITALASHMIVPGKYNHVIVGVHTAQGAQMLLYAGSADGLALESSVPLQADATAFAFGKVDADPVAGIVVLAGGQPAIYHTAQKNLESLAVPFHAAAIDLGHFLPDRVSINQIALLSTDGTLHYFARDNIDTSTPSPAELLANRRKALTPGGAKELAEANLALMRQPFAWKEFESVSNAGPVTGDGRAPLMFRTRVSNSSMDDVMLMNSAKLSVVGHAAATPLKAHQDDRFDLAANAAAALPVRTSIDGRPGVVFVAAGEPMPQVIHAASNATYTVNRTDDPAPAGISSVCNGGGNDCSLREAILKANADGGTDTIVLGSATYTLSQARTGTNTGTNGALQVFANMNIVGSGSSHTIVQGGTATGPSCNTNHACNDVDLVIAVNEDVNSYTNSTASLTGFTIQNGFNRGDVLGVEDGFGGGLDFDTGSSGTNTLTLTGMVLQNNSSAEGGAFNAFNFQGGTQNDPTGPATVTITNSVFQNNTAYPFVSGESENQGGGISLDVQSRMVMTNCQVSGNAATYSGTGGNNGEGGGLFLQGNYSPASALNKIHSTTITGNSVTEAGGGIEVFSGLILDTGSVVANNSVSLGSFGGGGISLNVASPNPMTISNVTFTENSAPNGGAILNTSSSNTDTITYSRFFSNTGTGSNINNSANLTITANDNWWATNSSSAIQGTISNSNSGVTTVSNWLELALSAGASSVTVGGTSSTTVTASFLKDSANNTIAATNLAIFAGVPVSFGSATKGSISNAATVMGNAANITAISQSGATVTVTAANSFASSQVVYITGVGSGYNGQYTITSANSSSFQFTAGASNLPSLGSGGIATVPSGTATATFTGTHVGLGSLQATVDGLAVTSPNIAVNSTTTASAANASASYSGSGQSVTLTAGLTAGSGDTVSGGTVTFSVFNGGTQVGSSVTSGTVSGGSASAAFSLPGGTSVATYAIHASYSGTSTGNGDFLSSSDNTHTLTVNKANTTTSAVNQTVNFSSSSQPAALSATVTSGAGAVNEGTVTFTVLNGGTPVGTATTSGTVSGGNASVTYTLPAGTPIGTYAIQAVFNASTNFNTSSDNTHTLSVSAPTTTSAVNQSASFSSSSQAVTLTANVTSGAGTVSSGTVTFTVFSGPTQIGSATAAAAVTSGTASASYTLPGGTATGTYTIIASYTGAGGFNSSSDNTHTLTVIQAATTTAASNQTATFSESAQSVTLSAGVTSGGGTVTAGTVTFTLTNNLSQTVGTATTSAALITGSASVAYSLPANTPAGTYTIQATYNPSTNFGGSSDSSHHLTVNNANTTTAAVNQSTNFNAANQNVTLSATVTSGAGAVNVGTVTFTLLNSLSQPVGTATTSGTVAGGAASVSYSVPGGTSPGTYTIQAVYNAGASFNTSSDATHTLTINAASTTTAASNATGTFSESSQSVTLNATVSSGAGSVNAGTVTFSVGALGSVTSGTVTSGAASASFTVPANTAAASYTITATYNPGGMFQGSSDNTHTLTLSNAASSIVASNQSAGFGASSQSVSLSAAVSSGAGAVNVGTVTFTLLNSLSQVVGTATTSSTVSGGAAAVNYSVPAGTAAGTYTIQATYNAGTNFSGSSDSSHTLTISASGTTTTAPAASAGFSSNAQNVTLSATVTSSAGTVNAGTVTFTLLNSLSQTVGTPATSSTVSSGGASVSYSVPGGTAAGQYTIQAVYNAAGSFNGSSDSSHKLTITAAATTTAASNATASFGSNAQSVTLTANVTSGAGTVNAGTVTFTLLNSLSQVVGAATTSAAITIGSASVSYTLPGGTPTGSYTVQAAYSGGGNFTGSNDSAHTLIISNAGTTTAGQNASAGFSGNAQQVTLNASVTSGGGPVNSGTVTFTLLNSSSQPVGTATTSATVNSGATSVSYTVPAGSNFGSYTIQAVYSPGAGYSGSSDSSHTLTISGGSTVTTASNATASFNSSAQGVTLSASVTSAAGTVNAGTVTFTVLSGATPVGTATTSGTVSNNSASVSYTLPGSTPIGSYTIQAVYNAGGSFSGSSDSSHTLTISSTTTTSAANGLATFSPNAQSLTLSAGVSSPSGPVNSGTVTFTLLNSQSQAVGTATTSGTVTAGAASVNYTLPGGAPAGTYTIQASYNGGTNLSASSDSIHTLTVARATPSLNWTTPASLSFGSALSSEQLNATSSVPGSFVYTPPAGTVLPVGSNQTLSVQFTPTDTTDYNGASTSVLISVTSSASPATLVLTETLSRDPGTQNVIVTLTVSNTGGSPATNLQLNSATIGGIAATTPLPLAIPDVPGGGSSIITLTFPASAGTTGTRAVLSISGTFSGGAFGGSSRVALP